MRTPKTVALIFGIYVVVTALSLALAPHPFLRVLALDTNDVTWVRLAGVLGAVIGTYYLFAARSDDWLFFRATVVVRPMFLIALVLLAIAKAIPAKLIGF